MKHEYLSTACLHARENPELHKHCRSDANLAGEPKVPGQCKWCTAMCACPCHKTLAERVRT
jgi:hypothetical protein